MALWCQGLAGPRRAPDADGILEIVRQIGCLQLDPIQALARSHILVLWSRLGGYEPTDVDRLVWEERKLFEYWAHAASIVPTEEYPLHEPRMRGYRRGATPGTPGFARGCARTTG